MPERFQPVTDDRPHDTPWGALAWPPEPGLVLEGPVVTLSPTDATADATELFEALDHDRVWAHVAGRPADAAALSRSIEARRGNGFYPWTVRLTKAQGDIAAGAVVGLTAYLDVSVSDARLEIGWTTYTPAVWGGRVNPATKLLLLEHSFAVLGAGRVQLKTDARNHRSQQAIHRLGASYEGVLRRYQRRSDGTVRDTVLFSITAEEWPVARAGLLRRLAAE